MLNWRPESESTHWSFCMLSLYVTQISYGHLYHSVLGVTDPKFIRCDSKKINLVLSLLFSKQFQEQEEVCGNWLGYLSKGLPDFLKPRNACCKDTTLCSDVVPYHTILFFFDPAISFCLFDSIKPGSQNLCSEPRLENVDLMGERLLIPDGNQPTSTACFSEWDPWVQETSFGMLSLQLTIYKSVQPVFISPEETWSASILRNSQGVGRSGTQDVTHPGTSSYCCTMPPLWKFRQYLPPNLWLSPSTPPLP